MNSYSRPPVSNGNPDEQALIRRWWHEQHAARGRLVWEYCLNGLYADAIWFPDSDCSGVEETGKQSATRFPLNKSNVVLCEAKLMLTPELIGQALVYAWYIRKEGANLLDTVIFAGADPFNRSEVAAGLGITVVTHPGFN